MSTLEKLLEVRTTSLLTVSAETTLREACAYFIEYGVGSFLVEDEHSICGIFTERDVKRALAHGFEPDDTTVEEMMHESIIIARPDDSIVESMQHMAQAHIHHLPVVAHNGRIIGIVSMHDLVRAVHGATNDEFEYMPKDACPVCGTTSVSDEAASETHRHPSQSLMAGAA